MSLQFLFYNLSSNSYALMNVLISNRCQISVLLFCNETMIRMKNCNSSFFISESPFVYIILSARIYSRLFNHLIKSGLKQAKVVIEARNELNVCNLLLLYAPTRYIIYGLYVNVQVLQVFFKRLNVHLSNLKPYFTLE